MGESFDTHGTLLIEGVCRCELKQFILALVASIVQAILMFNHKNYNFLDCDWFNKLLFSTNSLAKFLSGSFLLDSLLSDSLLLDSSISQSHSLLSGSLLLDSSISQSHSQL